MSSFTEKGSLISRARKVFSSTVLGNTEIAELLARLCREDHWYR